MTNRARRARSGWSVLGLAVGLLLTGCSDSDPSPAPTASATAPAPTPSPTMNRAGGSLRVGLAEPATLDPGFIRDEAGQLVIDALFDSLVALDRSLEPIPAAATSWEINEDGTSFTFTLADATFHNGDPVTADDFVRSFNRIAQSSGDNVAVPTFQLEPIVGYRSSVTDGDPLEGVVANEDGTLTINLSHAFPEFLGVLADPALAPVPDSIDDEAFAEQPIGNGPFEMGEPWQHGQFVRVVRFDDHPSPALLDEIVFTIYEDDPTLSRQWEDLLGGQLDVGNVPAERINDAKETFGESRDGFTGPGYLGGLTGTIYYYGFNTTLPPFDNVDVRRAFSMVMDRQTVATDIMQNSRSPADAIVPPSMPGASLRPCDHCVFAPNAAKALFDAAGGADLFDGPVEIVHNVGTTHEAIATEIADNITEHLGVQTTVRGLELDEYVGSIRETDISIFRFGWTATWPSLGSYLYPLFHQDGTSASNLSRFEDQTISDALDAARAEMDVFARREAWREVESDVLFAVPIAPLLFVHQTVAVRERVQEFHLGPLGHVDFASVWLFDQ